MIPTLIGSALLSAMVASPPWVVPQPAGDGTMVPGIEYRPKASESDYLEVNLEPGAESCSYARVDVTVSFDGGVKKYSVSYAAQCDWLPAGFDRLDYQTQPSAQVYFPPGAKVILDTWMGTLRQDMPARVLGQIFHLLSSSCTNGQHTCSAPDDALDFSVTHLAPATLGRSRDGISEVNVGRGDLEVVLPTAPLAGRSWTYSGHALRRRGGSSGPSFVALRIVPHGLDAATLGLCGNAVARPLSAELEAGRREGAASCTPESAPRMGPRDLAVLADYESARAAFVQAASRADGATDTWLAAQRYRSAVQSMCAEPGFGDSEPCDEAQRTLAEPTVAAILALADDYSRHQSDQSASIAEESVLGDACAAVAGQKRAPIGSPASMSAILARYAAVRGVAAFAKVNQALIDSLGADRFIELADKCITQRLSTLPADAAWQEELKRVLILRDDSKPSFVPYVAQAQDAHMKSPAESSAPEVTGDQVRAFLTKARALLGGVPATPKLTATLASIDDALLGRSGILASLARWRQLSLQLQSKERADFFQTKPLFDERTREAEASGAVDDETRALYAALRAAPCPDPLPLLIQASKDGIEPASPSRLQESTANLSLVNSEMKRIVRELDKKKMERPIAAPPPVSAQQPNS